MAPGMANLCKLVEGDGRADIGGGGDDLIAGGVTWPFEIYLPHIQITIT